MTNYRTPGEVADEYGVSLDTLRYYERVGVLNPVERGENGHRRYRDDDLALLDLVRCLRETDMPMAELRRFADLIRAGDATIPARIALLDQHDADLAERIAQLNQRREAIRKKIDYYRGVLAEGGGQEPAATSTESPADPNSPEE
ncbi:MerR family transcriptional regulator [Allostreptomyces psammosilenae]|uniref:DNA-binding transcriptional MerR regulator n=1 Tax=Allostreptomyces psammosilenae TaxID=1892865 RepID=A0A852ZPG0_9ACTN|nr:MerR family transcriptional regulator [Allostreptomyces psammosilenae]NYI03615.1 DNA-binding transcriptional MerR regulator [Allostreptomyces psammosilenae]